MRTKRLVLGLALALGGCAAEVVDDADTAEASSPASLSIKLASFEEAGGEPLGTATDALTDGQRVVLCQAAAAVGSSLGCAAVTASCAATDVLTVGAVTIPCVLVVAFACATYVGGTSVIMTYCPEYVNR